MVLAGKRIFPFSLHEEDMSPKMEYTRQLNQFDAFSGV